MITIPSNGYDGEIRINTKIDDGAFDRLDRTISNLIHVIKEMSEALKDSFANINFSGVASSAEKAGNTIVENTKQAAQAAKEADESFQSWKDAAEDINVSFWDSDSSNDALEELGKMEDSLEDVNTALESVSNAAQEANNEIGNMSYSYLGRDVLAEVEEINNKLFSSGEAAAEQIEASNESILKLGNSLEEYKTKLKALEDQGHKAGSKEWDETYKAIQDCSGQIKEYKNSLIDMPKEIIGSDNVDREKTYVEELGIELRTLEDELRELELKGFNMGSEEWDHTYVQIQNIKKELKDYQKGLEGVDEKQKEVGKSAKKSRKEINKYKESASVIESLSRGFERLRRRIMRIATAALVFNVVRKGLSSLSSYLGKVLTQNNQFTNSLARIKGNLLTAFQPIYDYVLPAINAFMEALAKLTSYLAMFINMLFGKSVSDSAKSAQNLYNSATNAAEAEKDLAEAIEDVEEAASGALADFDKLNVLQKDTSDKITIPSIGNDKSNPDKSIIPDFSDMSESNPALQKFAEWLEKIKDALGPTIAALENLKKALVPLKEFAAKGLIDFYNNFLVPVGKWFLSEEGLPRLINLIADTLNEINWSRLNASLEEFFTQLSRAAIFVGTAIIDFYEYALKPIAVWVMGEGLPRFIDAISEGLAMIDFDRIREALIGLWEAIAPFAINVGEGLLWFFENVLVPLAVWTISDVLPLFLDGLAAIFEILNAVIDAIKPNMQYLWDNVLLPFAQYTGGIIVDVLGWVVEKLVAFGEWARDNQEIVGDVSTVLLGMFAGIITYKTVSGVLDNIGKAMGSFGKILQTLTDRANLTALAIGAIVMAIILVAENWDQMNDLEKIVAVLGLVTAAAFAAAIAIGTFQSAATLGVAAAAIAAGIAAVMIAINSAKSRAGSTGGSGGVSSKGIARSSAGIDMPSMRSSDIRVPALASGSVIPPNKRFLAELGDNTREHEIVSPVSMMKQAFKDAIAESGTMRGNNNMTCILEVNGSELARTTVPYIEEEQQRIGMQLVNRK